jgi:hypothetical protein
MDKDMTLALGVECFDRENDESCSSVLAERFDRSRTTLDRAKSNGNGEPRFTSNSGNDLQAVIDAGLYPLLVYQQSESLTLEKPRSSYTETLGGNGKENDPLFLAESQPGGINTANLLSQPNTQVITAAGILVNSIRCQVCGLNFAKAAQLKIHVRIVNSPCNPSRDLISSRLHKKTRKAKSRQQKAAEINAAKRAQAAIDAGEETPLLHQMPETSTKRPNKSLYADLMDVDYPAMLENDSVERLKPPSSNDPAAILSSPLVTTLAQPAAVVSLRQILTVFRSRFEFPGGNTPCEKLISIARRLRDHHGSSAYDE